MSGAVSRRRAARREEILAAAWELSHAEGLSALSLRGVAARVGLSAPSLYEYFDSKDAICDAMFADGWRELVRRQQQVPEGHRRQTLMDGASAMLDFCAEDLPRYQLMFTRSVPGWEPSPDAFTPAIEYYELFRESVGAIGVTDQQDLDLLTGLIAGLAAQQAANEPGGRRWRDLLPQAIDMYLCHLDGTTGSRQDDDGRPEREEERG